MNFIIDININYNKSFPPFVEVIYKIQITETSTNLSFKMSYPVSYYDIFLKSYILIPINFGYEIL